MHCPPEGSTSASCADVALEGCRDRSVLDHLAEQTPDVVFVHLDEADHQGYVAGYYAMEDWLVVVTTDPGGLGRGPGLAAVPPTVMKHLGLSVDAVWGWESEAFGFWKRSIGRPATDRDHLGREHEVVGGSAEQIEVGLANRYASRWVLGLQVLGCRADSMRERRPELVEARVRRFDGDLSCHHAAQLRSLTELHQLCRCSERHARIVGGTRIETTCGFPERAEHCDPVCLEHAQSHRATGVHDSSHLRCQLRWVPDEGND